MRKWTALILFSMCSPLCPTLYAAVGKSGTAYKLGQLFGALLLVCLIIAIGLKLIKRKR